MDLNNLILFFLIIVFGFLFNNYILRVINKYRPKFLIDDQFLKPQAFHENPVSTAGGLYIFISFLIVFFNFSLTKNMFFIEHLSFCTLFFLLGFLDDFKIDIKARTRLILMIVILLALVKWNNFYIDKTGIEFLDQWIKDSKIFSLIFVCLCFLFIINGANLIDGYNGLLGIHSLIILTNLFFVNYLNGNDALSILLFFSILIVIMFLIFNFPKAKIFLGDSGSYFLGCFVAISTIKTSIANPEISPFYFCILLFYLFFEVFFSFFRKLVIEKTPPIHPDKKHLHMLLYKVLLKKGINKAKSNYGVSIIINLFYLVLIIPPIFMMNNGIFCKYYSILFFVLYIFCYRITYDKAK